MMQRTSFLLRYRLHHLVFWALVFGIWYFLRVEDYARPVTALKVTAVKVADLAIMIYIVNYLFIPRLLYRKRYALFTVACVVLILTSSICKMYIIGDITRNPAMYDWSLSWKKRVYDNVLPHFFLVAAGAAIKLMLDYGRLQKRMAETAREKAETELNFLKSQINPHFVFNSLNAIYFLIHKENSSAREALHKFSEMLRYQLYEMNEKKIPVEKEIRYLRDYVDLQQLRKDEHYTVRFTCAGSVSGFSIEPLLLVPLVENAFKHISHHAHQPNFVDVKLDRLNGRFLFSVENSKESHRSNEAPGGIGLQNVKRRLALLYPGRHQLLIRETAEQFNVELQIQIS